MRWKSRPARELVFGPSENRYVTGHWKSLLCIFPCGYKRNKRSSGYCRVNSSKMDLYTACVSRFHKIFMGRVERLIFYPLPLFYYTYTYTYIYIYKVLIVPLLFHPYVRRLARGEGVCKWREGVGRAREPIHRSFRASDPRQSIIAGAASATVHDG